MTMRSSHTFIIRLFLVLLLVVLGDTGIFSNDATLKSASALESNDARLKLETRAIWSRIGAQGTVTRADVDELVSKVDEANLNVVFLATYKESAFFEPSHKRFPDASVRLPNRSSFRDAQYKDALSYLLSIRNKRRVDSNPANDFEVHAWFNVHYGGRRADRYPHEDLTEPYMLNGIFPEFKMKLGRFYQDDDAGFIDHRISVFQQPKFRSYMANLIAGLVEDYGVDGVHLDHIRTGGICFNNESLDYSGTKFDFPGCQKDYENFTRQRYGRAYSLWDDTDAQRTITDGGSGRVSGWLEHSVRLLLTEIRYEVKRIRPDMIISVASVRNSTDDTARKQSVDGQVAYEWLMDGLIDAAFITLYSENTSAVQKQIENYVKTIPDPHTRSLVFPGLATSNVDGDKAERTGLLLEQVEAVMSEQTKGTEEVSGVALFRFRYFNDEAVDLLAKGPFNENVLPYWGETPTGVHFVRPIDLSPKDSLTDALCSTISLQLLTSVGICPAW